MRDNETMENFERTENPFGDLSETSRVPKQRFDEIEEPKPETNRNNALSGDKIKNAHATLDDIDASINTDEQTQ